MRKVDSVVSVSGQRLIKSLNDKREGFIYYTNIEAFCVAGFDY